MALLEPREKLKEAELSADYTSRLALLEMNKALPYQEAVNEYGPTTRLRRAYTYKSLNRLIQAAAADMTKKAMVDVYKAGTVPLLQVHDELAFSVKSVEQARELSEIMKNAIPLVVPNKCDIEIGPNWGDFESVD